MSVEWIIKDRRADEPEVPPSREEIARHNFWFWVCLVALFFGFLAGLVVRP